MCLLLHVAAVPLVVHCTLMICHAFLCTVLECFRNMNPERIQNQPGFSAAVGLSVWNGHFVASFNYVFVNFKDLLRMGVYRQGAAVHCCSIGRSSKKIPHSSNKQCLF